MIGCDSLKPLHNTQPPTLVKHLQHVLSMLRLETNENSSRREHCAHDTKWHSMEKQVLAVASKTTVLARNKHLKLCFVELFISAHIKIAAHANMYTVQ